MIKFCSFNRKYKTKTFHFPSFTTLSLSPPRPTTSNFDDRTKPHPIYPVRFSIDISLFYMHAYLALSLFLGLLMNACTHTRSHSLSLSIFVISLCSSLVTFDVDMLRQSHQLPFTQSDYTMLNVDVFVCFTFFPPFCSNHNHFGKIESAFYFPSDFSHSFARSAFECVCDYVFFHLNFN